MIRRLIRRLRRWRESPLVGEATVPLTGHYLVTWTLHGIDGAEHDSFTEIRFLEEGSTIESPPVFRDEVGKFNLYSLPEGDEEI